MDKKRSVYTKHTRDEALKERNRKVKGHDRASSTSHTQFYKKEEGSGKFKRITSAEYLGLSESKSGTSDSLYCVHRSGENKYEKEKLKRNLLKKLDTVPVDPKWNDGCPLMRWDVIKTIEFLVKDPVGCKQVDRIQAHINDLVKISQGGYRIDSLNSLCLLLDYLVEELVAQPSLKEHLIKLLKNMNKPIILNVSSDVVTHFEALRNYLGYLGYLLIRIEDDELFDLVSQALIWQLSTPDATRNHSTKLRHTLAAAAPVLYQTAARMLALATPQRFPTFLNIAFILACDSSNNCIEMIRENIIENIMGRFNPFYPDALPPYETTTADPRDMNLKLGDSSTNMSTTLSLLLILLKTLKCYLDENPKCLASIPSPDYYAQRCFIWAYRYECRAEHRHERIALTVIAHVLLKCYGERLMAFSTLLMPDVMRLAVLTEVPPRQDWTSTVKFNTGLMDVQFKKVLIYLSVDLLKMFPYNNFMPNSELWLLALIHLLDPCLEFIRAGWSPSSSEELRKIALQALVCILPYISLKLVSEYGLIRRIMLYLEWYIESPYELSLLYWCVRLLHVSTYQRHRPLWKRFLKELYKTYGIIILTNLCYTLLEQKQPPMERSQMIISLCLQYLTNALLFNDEVSSVHPQLKWPDAIYSLAWTMLDTIVISLENHFIINDRFLVSSLDFIWEVIKWKPSFMDLFVSNGGVYKLLDLITMIQAPVQCLCLAMLCDIAGSGSGVGQIVSWRANTRASDAYPNVVKKGATIMTLLASVSRDECLAIGVQLDSNGVIENLDNPLMSKMVREEMKNINFENENEKASLCLTAADLCGSRMSKVFTLLYLLSEDLASKVSLADEAYNLYKNVNISPDDEVIIVLCSHYLTLKLNETWSEIKARSPVLLPQDDQILQEFLQLNVGWSKEVQKQQIEVLEKDRKKGLKEENSLYAVLGRIRLNVALDALRELRCVARSADRTHMIHAMLQNAVRALNQRTLAQTEFGVPIIRTYSPPLDE